MLRQHLVADYISEGYTSAGQQREDLKVRTELIESKGRKWRIYIFSERTIASSKAEVKWAIHPQPTDCIKLSNIPMKLFKVRGIIDFQVPI